MWKYKGKGEWLPGVPARDLTDDEAKLHKVEVEGSALYEKIKQSADPKADGDKES